MRSLDRETRRQRRPLPSLFRSAQRPGSAFYCGPSIELPYSGVVPNCMLAAQASIAGTVS